MSKAVKEVKIEEVVEEIPVKESVEEVIERPYALRRLRDDDLYPLLQLLRKLGIKDCRDEIMAAIKKNRTTFDSSAYENEEEGKEALKDMQERVSIDIMTDLSDFLISKICTHSNELYEFYSNLAGVSADKIRNMEFGTLPLMIYDSFSEVKNTAFFKVLAKLL